jgi:hypothetical protein
MLPTLEVVSAALSRNPNDASGLRSGGRLVKSGMTMRIYFSLLSSLARSNAPRLVVPAFSRAEAWLKVAMASL